MSVECLTVSKAEVQGNDNDKLVGGDEVGDDV